MTLLLTDADLLRVLEMRPAIEAVEEALQERAAGRAVSLPRTGMEVASGRLVFTPGGFPTLGLMGLRIYPQAGDQLVAVWSTSGELNLLITGQLLGAIRTGAIGGVALKHLAPRGAETAAVIGAGLQGWTQLLAARELLPLREVRIYRRNREMREALARRWSNELSLPVTPAESAREAVAGAEVVICATNASEPVLEAGWLAPGAHLSSLGPKYRGRTELGGDVVAWASRIYSDFPEQYRREERFLLQGTPHLERLEDLTRALGRSRPDSETTLFLSHGLAGTEVAVAAALGRLARSRGVGQELHLPPPDLWLHRTDA
ncbi:MAG: ornithine cyclodeaminase family protein [Bacillota bacterium]